MKNIIFSPMQSWKIASLLSHCTGFFFSVFLWLVSLLLYEILCISCTYIKKKKVASILVCAFKSFKHTFSFERRGVQCTYMNIPKWAVYLILFVSNKQRSSTDCMKKFIAFKSTLIRHAFSNTLIALGSDGFLWLNLF